MEKIYNLYLRKNNGEVNVSYTEKYSPGMGLIILSEPTDENGREIVEASKGLIKRLNVDELIIKVKTK